MNADDERLLLRAYAAFNSRDIDAAIALMHDDVDWPNAMEGGRVHGHAGVRVYWMRQFTQVESHVEPERFSETEDGRVAVDVHQVVNDLDGNLLSDSHVTHVYTIRDGLVERMDVEGG
jgi:hypothetical protein